VTHELLFITCGTKLEDRLVIRIAMRGIFIDRELLADFLPYPILMNVSLTLGSGRPLTAST